MSSFMQKKSLFSRGIALLYIFHLTVEVTRLAVKWECDYQEEVFMQVKGGKQCKWGKQTGKQSKPKQNLLQNLRSFPCHTTGFKKPKIKHTSTQTELKNFVRFCYFSSPKENVALNNDIQIHSLSTKQYFNSMISQADQPSKCNVF